MCFTEAAVTLGVGILFAFFLVLFCEQVCMASVILKPLGTVEKQLEENETVSKPKRSMNQRGKKKKTFRAFLISK